MNTYQPAVIHPETRRTDDKFTFSVIPDRGGGARAEVFDRIIEQSELLAPDFTISIGELLDGYGEENEPELERIINKEWDDVFASLKTVSRPFYFCPGWHDIRTPEHDKIYQQRIGNRRFSWEYKNCKFIVLDAHELYTKGNYDKSLIWQLGSDQLRWFEQAVRAANTTRHIFVFIHAFYKQTERDEIANILNGHPSTLFCGSSHVYRKSNYRDLGFYQLGRAGAAQFLSDWEIALGAIDHFTWVTVTGNEVKIANLILDGVLPDDFCTNEIAEKFERSRK